VLLDFLTCSTSLIMLVLGIGIFSSIVMPLGARQNKLNGLAMSSHGTFHYIIAPWFQSHRTLKVLRKYVM
jgi:hypothetical protein